jgi:hypothetical protein
LYRQPLIDDIVGLVIAATVKQLAPADAMTSLNRATIAQPILVSLAVIIIPIPLVRYNLAPCYMRLLMHVLIAMCSFGIQYHHWHSERRAVTRISHMQASEYFGRVHSRQDPCVSR